MLGFPSLRKSSWWQNPVKRVHRVRHHQLLLRDRNPGTAPQFAPAPTLLHQSALQSRTPAPPTNAAMLWRPPSFCRAGRAARHSQQQAAPAVSAVQQAHAAARLLDRHCRPLHAAHHTFAGRHTSSNLGHHGGPAEVGRWRNNHLTWPNNPAPHCRKAPHTRPTLTLTLTLTYTVTITCSIQSLTFPKPQFAIANWHRARSTTGPQAPPWYSHRAASSFWWCQHNSSNSNGHARSKHHRCCQRNSPTRCVCVCVCDDSLVTHICSGVSRRT